MAAACLSSLPGPVILMRPPSFPWPQLSAWQPCLADLVVQLRVAVPAGLEGDEVRDGGGPGRVQESALAAKQLRQHLSLRQAQTCSGTGACMGLLANKQDWQVAVRPKLGPAVLCGRGGGWEGRRYTNTVLDCIQKQGSVVQWQHKGWGSSAAAHAVPTDGSTA